MVSVEEEWSDAVRQARPTRGGAPVSREIRWSDAQMTTFERESARTSGNIVRIVCQSVRTICRIARASDKLARTNRRIVLSCCMTTCTNNRSLRATDKRSSVTCQMTRTSDRTVCTICRNARANNRIVRTSSQSVRTQGEIAGTNSWIVRAKRRAARTNSRSARASGRIDGTNSRLARTFRRLIRTVRQLVRRSCVQWCALLHAPSRSMVPAGDIRQVRQSEKHFALSSAEAFINQHADGWRASASSATGPPSTARSAERERNAASVNEDAQRGRSVMESLWLLHVRGRIARMVARCAIIASRHAYRADSFANPHRSCDS